MELNIFQLQNGKKILVQGIEIIVLLVGALAQCNLFIYLLIYLFIYLFIHLFIYLFVYLFVYLFILFIYLHFVKG